MTQQAWLDRPDRPYTTTPVTTRAVVVAVVILALKIRLIWTSR